MLTWITIGVTVFLAAWVLFFILKCFVVVGGTEIAILERKFVGKPMPQGRVIAQAGEIGIKAHTLGPGFHFLAPFIMNAHTVPFIVVGNTQVGLVEALDGNPIPSGQIFASVTDDHQLFQDGESFLHTGQKGPQVQTLPPGQYRINPNLFRVTLVDQIAIPLGKIGVVTCQDGRPLPSGRLLATHIDSHDNFQKGEVFLTNGGQKGPQIDIILPGTYRINRKLFNVNLADAVVIESGKIGVVTALDGAPLPDSEYVAKYVEGHNDYQSGQMFLNAGGQRGPQLAVLRPGIYYVNPLMFTVNSDTVTRVETGHVAVVVSNIGDEPTEEIRQKALAALGTPALETGREKYVVPKGYRGIQEEVMGPGIYYLNKNASIPYVVDTTNQTIDWAEGEKNSFNPLYVVSKDGFPISVSVKVVIRVRPDQAPYMVAKVGSIENLIRNVVHPMIDSSFRNQASTTAAMQFMQERQVEQQKAEDRTRAELEKYHVECVAVLICQIALPQALMDTQTSQIIAQQQTNQFQEQQKSEEARIKMEKTRATATQQPELARAEIAVQVAEQEKQRSITLAEGSASAVKLKGEGDAAAIAAIGAAEAGAYQAKQEAMGKEAIAIIEGLKQVVPALQTGNVKLVPDILSVGSGGEGLLGTLLTRFMANAATKQPVLTST